MRFARFSFARFLFAALLAGCAGALAPLQPNPGTAVGSHAPNDLARAWSRSMMQVPLPKTGCFRAAYPAVTWSRVACVAPPHVLFARPARGTNEAMRPAFIGNTKDYVLDALSLSMVGAIGSFPSVSGVRTVHSCAESVAKPYSCGRKGSKNNVYSLQLNSNTFSTAACGKLANCAGWEQFVYTNQPRVYSGGGNLIIQDWLLTTNGSTKLTCPPNAGWQSSGGSCVKDAPYSILLPTVPVTELSKITLGGSATSSGDSVFMAVVISPYDSYVYGIKNAQDDTTLYLSQHWTQAEFNVFGNGGGDRAVFNQGTTITVSVEGLTGYSTAPDCKSDAGSTGEENSLWFVAPPMNPNKRQYPSILFTESNIATSYAPNPSCVTLAGR